MPVLTLSLYSNVLLYIARATTYGMNAEHLAEEWKPGCALLDFAGRICDHTCPKKTQKNDSQPALPGEADFVQRHRQASL